MAEKKTEAKPERKPSWPMKSARVDVAISRELSELLEERYHGRKRAAIARVEETVQLRQDADLKAKLKSEIAKEKTDKARKTAESIPTAVLESLLAERRQQGVKP